MQSNWSSLNAGFWDVSFEAHTHSTLSPSGSKGWRASLESHPALMFQTEGKVILWNGWTVMSGSRSSLMVQMMNRIVKMTVKFKSLPWRRIFNFSYVTAFKVFYKIQKLMKNQSKLDFYEKHSLNLFQDLRYYMLILVFKLIRSSISLFGRQ